MDRGGWGPQFDPSYSSLLLANSLFGLPPLPSLHLPPAPGPRLFLPLDQQLSSACGQARGPALCWSSSRGRQPAATRSRPRGEKTDGGPHPVCLSI